MKHPDPRVSYEAALAFDGEGAVSAYTLPDLRRHVQQAAYVSDIADESDAMTHFISKVLPAPCHNRKYEVAAEELTLESPDDTELYESIVSDPTWSKQRKGEKPEKLRARMKIVSDYRRIAMRRECVQQVFLCSLLGNYRHVETTDRITDPNARAILCRIFHPSNAQARDVWYQSILHQCRDLLEWSFREYVVYVLLDNPGMLDAVGDLICFDRFRELTAQAMRYARGYIQSNIGYAWSSLGTHVQLRTDIKFCRCMNKLPNVRKGQQRPPPHPCRFESITWLRDVSLLLSPFAGLLATIFYSKPDAGPVAFILSKEVRKAIPMVPRPLGQEEAAQLKREEEARAALQREQAQADLRHSQLDLTTKLILDASSRDERKAMSRFERMFGKRTKKRNKAAATSEKVKDTIADPRTYLIPEQFSFLLDLAPRCRTIEEMVDLFPDCGRVPAAAVELIHEVLQSHRDGSITRKGRMMRLEVLREMQPHAYNLLQASSFLLRDTWRRQSSRMGTFFAHTCEAQVRAAKRKSLEALQADDMAHLTACNRHIASFERKLQTLADRHESRMSKSETYSSSVYREEYEATVERLRSNVTELKEVTRPCIEQRLQRIATEWHTNAKEGVDPNSVHLFFCPVCMWVYSNVCDAHSMYNTYCRWGLHEAEFNFATQTMHCNRFMTSYAGRCDQKPLVGVNLLGARFRHRTSFGMKVYQLCVQCCIVMVPDPFQCVHTEEGMLCLDCSRQHTSARVRQRITALSNQIRSSGTPTQPCAMCPAYKKGYHRSAACTFQYPFGLVLCRRHHSRGMQEHIAAQLDTLQSAEHTLQVMVAISRARRQVRMDQIQPATDKRMKLQRRIDRSKRR